MSRKLTYAVMFGLVAALASTASAQVCSAPGQLASGCAMNDVSADWTLVTGASLSQADTVGHDAPPSAEMIPTFDEGGYVSLMEPTQCLAITAGQPVWIGAAIRFENASSVSCTSSLVQYSDADSTTLIGAVLTSSGGGTFTTPGARGTFDIEYTSFLPSATNYRMGIKCSSVDDSTLYIDDVWTATVKIPVFADGFETGDMTAWSAVVAS